jgi:hypothetical protein
MGIVHENELEILKRRIETIENRFGNINYELKGVVKSELTAGMTVIQASQMQYGLYTAMCVDTIDIWKQNRIRWFSPLFHNPKQDYKEFPWALPVSSMGGFDDCGLTWVPPAGSTVCVLFENGNRECPFYIGTTWHRDRGPDGNHKFGVGIPEYDRVSEGHRKGYMVGPNDGSQVFPPWNTENYNGYDLSSVVDFASNPEAQKIITYPNIYGFKTPEKHMIKMVDGDPKCNRKWKRFEIMSSCGNWIMLKDDHLHYAGQWANPQCGGIRQGETSCVEGASNSGAANATNSESNPANVKDITPKFGKKKEETSCDGKQSNSKIIGGHPSTAHPQTKYIETQVGHNPFFKHSQECRPYRGPGTPQNPYVDLPQSGIQIMSISGHTFVMDDSVEEPSGNPEWERSMQEFDFGCNNHYVGRTYWQSATGHRIEMSDVESPQGDEGANLRGEYNYIKMTTANGNKIEMNDHTIQQKDCPGCPPNIAGEKRGIHLQSTSNHTIDMVDYTNEQCGPCRREGGVPINEAKRAYVRIRTGYGLEMTYNDDFSQKETQQQYIQIFCPQKDNKERGPHIHRYQEAPSGPGLIFLRAGGNYVVSTYDNQISIIGDPDLNPSDKIEIISRIKLVYCKDVYVNVTDKLHLFLAKDKILLLAGEDNDAPPGGCCGGEQPNVGPVLVYDPCSGCIRLSDRIFGSTSTNAPAASIFMLSPFAKCPGC